MGPTVPFSPLTIIPCTILAYVGVGDGVGLGEGVGLGVGVGVMVAHVIPDPEIVITTGSADTVQFDGVGDGLGVGVGTHTGGVLRASVKP